MSAARTHNLADLFEGAADELSTQDAVVAGGHGVDAVRLSYADLDRRANRVANHLSGLGVKAGDHVAVHLTNRSEFLEVLLGTFKLRAVPVNANFRYTVDELRQVFDDAEVTAVITEVDGHMDLAERAAAAAGDGPIVRVGDDYEGAWPPPPRDRTAASDRAMTSTCSTQAAPRACPKA
ncbi:MAG: AMP-binding protein [Acidimicrobiales bacterium]